MNTEWERTKYAQRRLALTRDNLRLKFNGRHVIERDSPIDGGVSLGGISREAIVVDSQTSTEIQKLYRQAMESLRCISEEEVLYQTNRAVDRAMNYNNKRLEYYLKKNGFVNEKEVSIDFFLKVGCGVCRHSALVNGVLLELFRKDGFLQGRPSIDRCEDDRGAHEWCRYTNAEGQVHILDPAMRFFGTLEQSMETEWDYRRPEDKLLEQYDKLLEGIA